jgi:biotin carboxylase
MHGQIIVRRGTSEGRFSWRQACQAEEILFANVCSDIVRFECSWHGNNNAASPSSSNCWQSVNIILRELSKSAALSESSSAGSNARVFVEASSENVKEVGPDEVGSSAAFDFILECLSAAASAGGGRERAVKLIVPGVQGYIVRSDIIPLRLVDCQLAESVVAFSEPRQHFAGKSITTDSFERLTEVFAASAGGVLLAPNHGDIESDLLALDIELENRLSFPWLTKHQPPRQTLAMLCGGRYSPEHGGTGNSIYPAAKALGIDMVVLDSPGHWLDGPDYAHCREAFIPIELGRDSEFPKRIVEALRKYGKKIDGIITFFESYLVAVATAAAELSLPAAPPRAYEIATDKYRTSVTEGHKAYRASNLDEATKIVRDADLSYPLIVKPCRGWSSEGVSRVQSASDLSDAINAIDTTRHGTAFVIEEYCDGPEVDANIVLCDGEVLFFEVSDDFPKSAEAKGTGTGGNFIELANVLPSKLPKRELDILRDSLHQSLLRLGLDTGMYHLEARVQHSAMEYVMENDIVDLAYRKSSPTAEPNAWLIEINPRPPGIQESDASASTYGIDYWGLSLLFPLADKARARALSIPFASGPQYWCEIVFIPVEHGGIFDSDDVCVELTQRRPDLAAHISKAVCFWKKGDQVLPPDSGVTAWVAYFNVYSRTSRADVLEIAETVRQEFRFSII